LDDRRLLVELVKRQRQIKPKPDFIGALFPKQRAIALDPAKEKAALCTRRAGKSYGGGSLLYDAAYTYRDCTIPYISLTRKSAKNIMWPVMRKIKKKFSLDGARMLPSDLTVRFDEFGTEIPLLGADQENFIDRLRGGAYPLVIIDEAQSFGSHLSELIDDVIGPALMDYDGSVILLGTPGPICHGYFYEVTKLKQHGFSSHYWSLHDNIYLPNASKWLESHKKKKGWSDTHPTYLREYCGQWVEDPDALVYKFKRERNEYRELPKSSDWNRILSIDYGWNDQTAFGITAYNYKMPNVWLEHAEGASEMTPTDIAQKVEKLIKDYRPTKIVADTGGLGKSITEEMRKRYGIPIMPAQKTEKMTAIALLNGDMVSGHYKLHESLTPTVGNQMLTLVKADDGTEDPNLPNDLCDVALYGYREAKAYAHDVDPAPPKTEKEKWTQEAEKLLEAEEKHILEEASQSWWER
jgi:hypothetical protein